MAYQKARVGIISRSRIIPGPVRLCKWPGVQVSLALLTTNVADVMGLLGSLVGTFLMMLLPLAVLVKHCQRQSFTLVSSYNTIRESSFRCCPALTRLAPW